MSKYTQEQLKEMATEMIDAIRNKDERAEIVLQILSQIFGMPQQAIINRIADIRDKS
jgi:hypothetical protein